MIKNSEAIIIPMCYEAIKDCSGSFLFVFYFFFSCSSYSLPFFSSQLPCLCGLTCVAYHGQGQSATEVADLVQGRHKKWHIYSDRAFTWSEPSFRASYWKTVPAGKSLWASDCELPPAELKPPHLSDQQHHVSLWQLCKVDFDLHLLSPNLYRPCQRKI